MVQKAADYPWSSFKANAYGKEDQLTWPHPVYLALGANDGERRQAYRGLFRQALALCVNLPLDSPCQR